MKKWRDRNPNYFRYREANDATWKETCKERAKKWRDRHQEYLKLYRQEHKDRYRIYMREYMREYRKKRRDDQAGPATENTQSMPENPEDKTA
jgi:hypothetical protein